jgi:hypothetical protein
MLRNWNSTDYLGALLFGGIVLAVILTGMLLLDIIFIHPVTGVPQTGTVISHVYTPEDQHTQTTVDGDGNVTVRTVTDPEEWKLILRVDGEIVVVQVSIETYFEFPLDSRVPVMEYEGLFGITSKWRIVE